MKARETTLAVKTRKRFGERLKRELVEKKLLLASLKPCADEEFVFFPVARDARKARLATPHSFCVKKFVAREPPKSLERALAESKKFSEKELHALVKGFDVVGDIAVAQVPPYLRRKAALVALALLSAHPRLKTVFLKTGGRSGEYRTQRLRFLAGERKTLATLKENDCLLRVDVARTFFSPRLAFERARIASLARDGENVLVPFAGVGPFAIVVAKRVPTARIVAIELNPVAARLLRENLALNRVSERVRVIEGDAARAMRARELREWADRIVMPLPLKGKNFLQPALQAARRGAILHYYALGEKRAPFAKALAQVRRECERAGRKCVVLRKRRVIDYSPALQEIVLDLMVV